MKTTVEYLTEDQIFDTAIETAKGWTQTEMAEHLECSQAAVSKMLNKESKMLSLAVKWVEMRMPSMSWEIEKENDKPVRYYKVVMDAEEAG